MDIEDPNQLIAYLVRFHNVDAQDIEDTEVLGGGVSNRTVLVHRTHGCDWVLKQALAKLRVEEDWYSDPLRIHREAEGLRILSAIMPEGFVVKLVFEDEEHHIVAMEAVEKPHVNWKTALLDGRLDLSLVKQFGQGLGKIHTRFDIENYPEDGILRDQRFFESLRIEPYYLRAAERTPEAGAFINDLVQQTRMRLLTLVHGDYSPKNILVHKGQIVLLDHEVIHVGDPGFDVGFSMTHLLSKANHMEQTRSSFFEAAHVYWDAYLKALGDKSWKGALEPMVISHTLGCMLARIEGRSPLEYLFPSARVRQKEWCMQAIASTPTTVHDLIESYNDYLNKCR